MGGGGVERELLVISPEVEGVALSVAVETVEEVACEVHTEATASGAAAVGSRAAERAGSAMLIAVLLRRMPVDPLQDVLDIQTLPQRLVINARHGRSVTAQPMGPGRRLANLLLLLGAVLAIRSAFKLLDDRAIHHAIEQGHDQRRIA